MNEPGETRDGPSADAGPTDASSLHVSKQVATGDTADREWFPSISPQEYLTSRMEEYRAWYDRKAVKTKALHLRMRTLSVVGGAVVPVLVNLRFEFTTYLTTLISLMVVILVSLESVYHYREQWKNYRSTEQFLGHERSYYETRVGPYRDLSETDAFRSLVERVESAIAAENSSTLNIMTLASQVSGESKGAYG